MSVFGHYSRYYDLLYKDKDYAAEADFVHEMIQRHAPGAQGLLELGCGTGQHAELLARRGYSLHGIDLSEEMLHRAEQRRQELQPSLAERLCFELGDVRTVRLARQFDAVVSLFHVMSYQQTNDDLAAAFATAKEHLKPGGIFLFDCWYGPAVLTDPPVVRVKRLDDAVIDVTRIAEPVMSPNENIVDVNYQVFVQERLSGKVDILRETHRMRYLFLPEITFFLKSAGMDLVQVGGWLTETDPGFTSWNVYVVARRS